MKKRIISLLLVMCMAVALFAGMGVSAYADEAADTTTYTVKSGDTLWGLCNKQGINYYTCKNAIMSLNSFTSEYQLTHLTVGDTIKIPTSDAAGQKIGGSGSTTTSTSTVISGSTSTTTTTTTNALANGDIVSYYLIAHTMISGETVMGIYNAWGLNYRNYSDQILAVNGLTGFNKMYAGKTYLLPAPTIPSGAAAGYTIIAHKVVGGDSAYNLCRAYNTNYNNVSTVIKAANGGSNLTTIRSGQIVYIPATGAVSVAGSGSTGGAGSAGGTTGGTSGVISSTKYNLTKATATNGSFVLQSGGAEVSSVGSGASVSIVATPAYNYVVDTILVSKADDSTTTVATNSSVFTMPAYAVKVTVTFKLGSTTSSGVAHAINVSSDNGAVTAFVDGKEATSAKAGSFVTLKIMPNNAYDFSSVQVTYGFFGTKVPVSASNSFAPDAEGYIMGSFNMPDADVKVNVAYTAKKTYNIDRAITNSHGNFYVTVDGVRSDKAMMGQTIAIISMPDPGCSIKSLDVTYKSGAAVSMVDALTFIMPAQDVKIVMYYEAAHAIKSVATNGSLSYKVNGVATTSAIKDDIVEITATPNSGYVLDKVTVKKGTNVYTLTMTDNKGSFTMYDGEVTVTATFKAIPTYAVTATPDSNGNTFKFMVDGGYVTKVAADTMVTVVPVCKEGFSLTGTLSSTPTVAFDSSYKFKMPAAAVNVTGTFSPISQTDITVNYDTTYFNAPTLLVDGKTVSPLTATSTPGSAKFKVYPDKNAVLQVTCKDGYALKEAVATGTTISDGDVFKVGTSAITINLVQRGQYRSITSDAVSNGSFTMIDGDGQPVTNTAAAGSTIIIKPVADKGYEVDKITEKHLENGAAVTNTVPIDGSGNYIFTMPGADVTLSVTFKAKTMKIAELKMDETETTPKGFQLKYSISGVVGSTVATDGAPLANISVPAFAEVTLTPVLSLSGYSVVSVVITDNSGNNIISKIDYTANATTNNYTFKMPTDYDNIKITVTVSPDA